MLLLAIQHAVRREIASEEIHLTATVTSSAISLVTAVMTLKTSALQVCMHRHSLFFLSTA